MHGLPDLSPAEYLALRDRERAGEPFCAYRDGGGGLCFLDLAGRSRVSVGRSAQSELALSWDTSVSRVHALLERVAGEWTVVDDGLSRNGTFINAERLTGRRRLADRDVLRVGDTALVVLLPGPEVASDPAAETAGPALELAPLRPAQQRVLDALCAPLLDGTPGAVPAANREIAEALSISLDGVRTQMKTLFALLEVPDMPQNRKRADLARRALAAGLVSARR